MSDKNAAWVFARGRPGGDAHALGAHGHDEIARAATTLPSASSVEVGGLASRCAEGIAATLVCLPPVIRRARSLALATPSDAS